MVHVDYKGKSSTYSISSPQYIVLLRFNESQAKLIMASDKINSEIVRYFSIKRSENSIVVRKLPAFIEGIHLHFIMQRHQEPS